MAWNASQLGKLIGIPCAPKTYARSEAYRFYRLARRQDALALEADESDAGFYYRA
jgi:hypothetical protein